MLMYLSSSGQDVSGVVRDRGLKTTLSGVNVLNKTRGIQSQTGDEGQFNIAAGENEILIFYKAGYLPDTLLLVNTRPLIRNMIPDSKILNTVIIKGDNFSPEVQYAEVYKRAKVLTATKESPLTFYPTKYFSKEGRFARRFKKKLEREKSERKIDQRFNDGLVKSITPLRDRELDCFMVMYRPTLKTLNKLDKDDLFLYIMNSYKAFKLLPADQRVLPKLRGTLPLPEN